MLTEHLLVLSPVFSPLNTSHSVLKIAQTELFPPTNIYLSVRYLPGTKVYKVYKGEIDILCFLPAVRSQSNRDGAETVSRVR